MDRAIADRSSRLGSAFLITGKLLVEKLPQISGIHLAISLAFRVPAAQLSRHVPKMKIAALRDDSANLYCFKTCPRDESQMRNIGCSSKNASRLSHFKLLNAFRTQQRCASMVLSIPLQRIGSVHEDAGILTKGQRYPYCIRSRPEFDGRPRQNPIAAEEHQKPHCAHAQNKGDDQGCNRQA